MRGRIRILLFSLLFAAMPLAGCTADQQSAADMDKKTEAFKAQMQAISGRDQTDNTGIRIGSVNMGMNGEWFSEVMNGIWDAGQDLGVTVKMLDSAGDLKKEKENVKRLVDEGIDALVISPQDSEGSISCLEPAVKANIPIITWNTSVNMDVTSFVCVDSNALGADTGRYLCEYIKTYGLDDVRLIVIDNQNYDVGIARCNGFKNALKRMIEQGIVTIVAEDDAETFDAGVEVSDRLLKEHPEANAIWAWNQPSLLGTIAAVRESDRKDMLVMGTDMSMELAHDMLEDQVNLQAITTQMPYNMGYKAVETAVKAARGEKVDKTVVVPLFTYTKSEGELVKRYIKAHKNLVEWRGGQWYEE